MLRAQPFSETIPAASSRPAGADRSPASLAAGLTRKGSLHTYYTIRWLVDPDLVQDGFLAYGYFRWLDDVVDQTLTARGQRLSFVAAQTRLLNHLLAGGLPGDLSPEERWLADLVAHNRPEHGGLESYLRNMMAVMEFDARRRGRIIGTQELTHYTRCLSTAVMDGLTYFIGHRYRYPAGEARYRAVAAAHITHMLRDAVEDAQAGYFNIPAEILERERLTPADVRAPTYRAWVRARVMLARGLFREGKRSISHLACLRARLAGYAYCARFEAVLNTIERDDYLLRPDYGEASSPTDRFAGLVRVAGQALVGRRPLAAGDAR
jgi:phytoene/squalene synthetase